MKKIIKLMVLLGFGLTATDVFSAGSREGLHTNIEQSVAALHAQYHFLQTLHSDLEALKNQQQTPRVRARIESLNNICRDFEQVVFKDLQSWHADADGYIQKLLQEEVDESDTELTGHLSELDENYRQFTAIIQGTSRSTALDVAKVLGEVFQVLMIVKTKMEQNIDTMNQAAPGVIVDYVRLQMYKRILMWSLGGLGAALSVMLLGNYMEWWVMVIPGVSVSGVLHSLLNII
ncbi:hypothetical protein K2W90_05755 [Candidatus Babeliales bacterium]|nr:hypothetical protein [Candidatus Babeliales bacterium]